MRRGLRRSPKRPRAPSQRKVTLRGAASTHGEGRKSFPMFVSGDRNGRDRGTGPAGTGRHRRGADARGARSAARRAAGQAGQRHRAAQVARRAAGRPAQGGRGGHQPRARPARRGAGRPPPGAGGRRAGGAPGHRGDRRHPAGPPRVARRAASGQPHPRAHRRHLRPARLRARRRSGDRGRLAQLRGAELPAAPSGAGDARHLLLRGWPPVAHPHLGRAGALHEGFAGHWWHPAAADDRRRQGLSQRQRPDPHPDVPPGRGPAGRRARELRRPEGHARRVRARVARAQRPGCETRSSPR